MLSGRHDLTKVIGEKTVSSDVSYVLMFLGALLWLFAILSTRIWWIDPQYEFGLLQVLPIHFWAGLVCYIVGLLTTIRQVGKNTFLSLLLLLNFMITGVPVTVESNARIHDAWWHLATARTIVDSGNMESRESLPFMYLNWPGSFIFTALAVITSDVPVFSYIRVFPLISSSIFLMGYYLSISQLVKNEFHRRYGAIAILFFDPWLQFHNSPQAFALMLLPLILFTLPKSGRKWTLMTLLLYSSAVISHPITSIFLLLVTTTSYLMRQTLNSSAQRSQVNPVLLVTLLMAWLMHNATQVFNNNIARVAENIWNVSLVDQSLALLQRRSVLLPSSIRLTTCLFAVILTLTHLVLGRRGPKILSLAMGWTAAIVFLSVYDLAFLGGSFNDRSFMFLGLLTAPLSIEFLIEHRVSKPSTSPLRTCIGVAVLCLLAGNFYTLYYFENDFVVNDRNIAAVKFVSGYVSTHMELFGNRLSVAFAYKTNLNIVALYFHETQSVPLQSIVVFDSHSLLSTSPHMKSSRTMKALYIEYAGNPRASSIYNNGLFSMCYVTPASL